MADDKFARTGLIPGFNQNPSRRSFIKTTSVLGATGVLGLGGVLNLAADEHDDKDDDHDHRQAGGLTRGDFEILIAAEIAEALAVTTYTNIINKAPFFGRIPSDDQGYLQAARQEEMSHYLLEQSASGHPSPYTTFYYPPDMFADTQTTLNVLVTLETHLSRLISSVFDDLALLICGWLRRESWESKVTIGLSRGSSGPTLPRRMAGRLRKSQALRESRRASRRPTITATKELYAGRRSNKPLRR